MSHIPGLLALTEKVPELHTAKGVLRAAASFFGVLAIVLFLLIWIEDHWPFLALLAQLAAYGLNHFILRSFFHGREERLPYAEAFFNRFCIAAGINIASLLYILMNHGGNVKAVEIVPGWLGWLAALYLLASAVLLFVRGLRTAGVDTLTGVYIYYPDEGRQLDEAIYESVRHPVYAALDRTALAFGLINGTPYALFLAIFFMAVWHPVWIAMEERELVSRFGEAYRTYRDRVPAVMPASLSAEYGLWETLTRRASSTTS
jgi:protein-S-isoprenylcysteine O-methyltransferase Ste14